MAVIFIIYRIIGIYHLYKSEAKNQLHSVLNKQKFRVFRAVEEILTNSGVIVIHKCFN